MYQLRSFLFNTLRSYTRQPNKQTFSPASFYTNQLFTQTHFLQIGFYTNQLLHKRAFTRTSFYANQLFDQPAFTQTTFCTNQPLHTHNYTNQFLHKPAFAQTNFWTNHLYANHLLQRAALHNPCFGPVSQGPEGRRNAEGCYMYEGCIFKNYMISDAFNIIVIVISEIYAWYISIKKTHQTLPLDSNLKTRRGFQKPHHDISLFQATHDWGN